MFFCVVGSWNSITPGTLEIAFKACVLEDAKLLLNSYRRPRFSVRFFETFQSSWKYRL